MQTSPLNTALKSIFISRSLNDNSPFKHLNQNAHINLIDESLILTSQIRYSYTPQTKWIFFSSKNAIYYFFEQNPKLPDDVNYAVISPVSANYLLTFGKNAHFIGKGVDMVKIAKDFRDVLLNESVLFPQAIDSLQTIQKQLSFTNTCYNLYVYKTNLKTDFTIPYTDILIFTSPSNVIAYYTKYKINANQVVIAMGNSTKSKLSEYGINDLLMPQSFDEQGIINLLKENNLIKI